MDVMYLAYDIVLNNLNQLVVKLYRVTMKKEGKNTYYDFHCLNEIFCTEEELGIILKKLKSRDAISMNRFQKSDFSCNISNPLYTLQSLIFPFRNQLLERVYDEVIIDDNIIMNLYVTYVNVDTGVIKSIKVGDFGCYTEEKEVALKQEGFKPLGNSYLGNYIETLDSERTRSFELKRKNRRN